MKNTLALTAAAAAFAVSTAVAEPAVGPASAAGAWTIDKAHSEVGFQVRHLMTKVRGSFGAFDGSVKIDAAKPEASTVSFVVKAASVNTNETKRDEHLRSADFFDAASYPEIRFVSTSVRPAGENRYEVTGDLTLRGVTRKVSLPVVFLGVQKDPWGSEKAGFETAVTLNRKDYGMVWNKALDHGGTILGDEVFVTIALEAARAKAN
ncbi:MAG TPA: YceI family protein [Thermoanaerobaculia bacterium]|nr:YceI family protein [Thermoanaerobaculia bacterium]